METLNTIVQNAIILWNSPVDWSPTAGMIWLMPTLAISAVSFAVFVARDERRQRRDAIYREARLAALDRSAAWDANGYQEIIVYNSNR